MLVVLTSQIGDTLWICLIYMKAFFFLKRTMAVMKISELILRIVLLLTVNSQVTGLCQKGGSSGQRHSPLCANAIQRAA